MESSERPLALALEAFVSVQQWHLHLREAVVAEKKKS